MSFLGSPFLLEAELNKFLPALNCCELSAHLWVATFSWAEGMDVSIILPLTPLLSLSAPFSHPCHLKIWQSLRLLHLTTSLWWLSSKASACNAGGMGSIRGSGRFPWSKKWQPTPGFLPGKSHGQRSLVGSSMGSQRVWHDWVTEHAPIDGSLGWQHFIKVSESLEIIENYNQ